MRCPLVDTLSKGRENSLSLDKLRWDVGTARGSDTAVVSPADTEVITPPDTEILRNAHGDQNRGEVCIANQVNAGQLVAALGKCWTSRYLLGFRPSDGLFGRRSLIPAVG